MQQRLIRSTLTIALATAALGMGMLGATPSAHAASAARAAHDSTTLLAAVSGFGEAVTHPGVGDPNRYATGELIRRAPAGYVTNLLGPVQNPPPRYTFVVVSQAATMADVIMHFPYNPTYTLTDRLTFTLTAAGWKLANVQFVPGPAELRAQLLQTARNFESAIASRADARINRFATQSLLAHAPAGRVTNLFRVQNPARSARVDQVVINKSAASSRLTLRFGAKVSVVRQATWTHTSTGWKLSGIGGPGRG